VRHPGGGDRHDFVTIELVYEPGALVSAFDVLGDAGPSAG
jgi:hypothetical protein